MDKMTSKRALWEAVGTVVSGVLIVCGFLLYLVGPHSEDWPMFLAIILLPALLLVPLLYSRFMNGPRLLTPRQHLRRTIVLGSLALVYLVGYGMDPKVGWKSVRTWTMAGACLLDALTHLHRAYKKKLETLSTT